MSFANSDSHRISTHRGFLKSLHLSRILCRLPLFEGWLHRVFQATTTYPIILLQSFTLLKSLASSMHPGPGRHYAHLNHS